MLSHFLRLCISAILLVVVAGPCFSEYAADDGWRRTAQGWELLQPQAVRIPTLAAPRVPRPLPSFFHPLLLASIQAGVVAIAYRRYPVKLKDLRFQAL
jgi:hypothetical protein